MRQLIPRRRSRGALVATVVLLTAITLPAPRAGAQVPPTCGMRVTTPGTVIRLTQDLECVSAVFDIEAPGVQIDLNGHRIRELEQCERTAEEICGLFFGEGSDGSSISNGFLEGIELGSLNSNVLFSRLNVTRGTVSLAGPGSRLVDSVLTDSTVLLAHDGISVLRNWILRGNGVVLFNLDHAVRQFRVADNVVLDSTGDGIFLDTYFFDPNDESGEIASNVILRSARDGLHFQGELQDLGTMDIHDNTFGLNGDDGVDINGVAFPPIQIPGGPVTLTRNRAIDNGGRGVNAGWIPGIPTGIVDGGGNVAAGNAVTPQCIGVAC